MVILFIVLLGIIAIPNRKVVLTTSKRQNLNVNIKSNKEQTIKLKVTNNNKKDNYDIILDNNNLSTSNYIIYVLVAVFRDKIKFIPNQKTKFNVYALILIVYYNK